MVQYDVERLRGQGFVVDYDVNTDNLFIHNLERINELQGKTVEETNELRKEYEALIASTKRLNDENKANVNSWLDIDSSIRQTRNAIYDEWLQDSREGISFMELTDADKRDIIQSWRDVLDGIQVEIDYWTGRGFNESSDVIRSLTRDFVDAEKAISSTFDAIVANSSASLGEITKFYSDLLSAANEFADSGFITVQQFESIISVGIQHLSLLEDTNGQLVINEANIHKIVAARLEQLAADTAYAYSSQIVNALKKDENETLQNLIGVKYQAADATWALVDANLAMMKSLGMSSNDFDAVLRNINNLRTLSDNALVGIGQQTGQIANSLREKEQAYEAAARVASRAIQRQIDGIDRLNKRIQAQLDALRETRSNWETTIGYIVSLIDDQISAIEKVNDGLKDNVSVLEENRNNWTDTIRAAQDVIDSQIRLLEEERNALREKNDESERELRLAQLKQDLLKAQQRTMRVFVEGKHFALTYSNVRAA
jgi:hypothetical protein